MNKGKPGYREWLRGLSWAVMLAVAAFVAGVGIRLYAALIIKPFSGDSAVYALMAKHIFELRELYVYAPLLHYAGSLASYVGALLFSVLGVSYGTYSLVGIIFSTVSMAFSMIIARRILRSTGFIVACLLIALPPFLTLYFSIFTGVHAELFLFAPILLLMAIKLNKGEYGDIRGFLFLTGIAAGMALWSTPAIAPCLLTLGTLFIMKRRETLSLSTVLALAAGFLIGYLPAIIYNFQYPGATLFRMAGKALDLDRSALSDPNLAALIARQALWRLATAPRALVQIPVLTAQLVSIPVALIAFAGLCVSLAGAVRGFVREKKVTDTGIIVMYALWFIPFYVLLVGENAPRYMTPLAIAVPFFVGDLCARFSAKGRALALAIVGALVLCNIATVAGQSPRDWLDRYSPVERWLERHNTPYAYADYETAYMVQFVSGEKTVISATLLHPTYSDRWPEETKRVRNAAGVCYIIDDKTYAGMAESLEKAFKDNGMAYTGERTGDFVIFETPGRSVPPDQLIGSRLPKRAI